MSTSIVFDEYNGHDTMAVPINRYKTLRGGGTFWLDLFTILEDPETLQTIKPWLDKQAKAREAKDIYKFAGEAEFVKYCEKHGLDELKLKNQIKGV